MEESPHMHSSQADHLATLNCTLLPLETGLFGGCGSASTSQLLWVCPYPALP